MRGAVEPLSRRASIRTQSLLGSVPAWCPKEFWCWQSLNRGLSAREQETHGGRRSHQDPANSSSQATFRMNLPLGDHATARSSPWDSPDLKGW
jgi:hypothetical protein